MTKFESSFTSVYDSEHKKADYSEDELNDAQIWLTEAQSSLSFRIAQYLELGNVEAVEHLLDLHQPTLDMIMTNVQKGNPAFIKMLSRFEDEILVTSSPGLPGYTVSHGLQLDNLATLVSNAQENL